MSEHTAKRTIATVLALLPDNQFEFQIDGRQLPVKAHPATGMRKKVMKVEVGDKVWIEPITGSSEWRMLELISS